MNQIPSDRQTWAMDLEGMKKAVAAYDGPSIVYLVNPNNPTSIVTPSAPIEEWIASKPANTIFILDEAYADYVMDANYRTADALVKAGAENVLVLRTFSKIHAMAGMRMGYLIASEERVKHVMQYVEEDAMTISYPGVMAGIASIQDKEFLELSKKSNLLSRSIMLDVLEELKLTCLPSQTNFLFHKINVPLGEYQEAMRQRHIIVGRAFPPAEGWCRLTLGTPGEMEFVAKTMRELRKKNLV